MFGKHYEAVLSSKNGKNKKALCIWRFVSTRWFCSTISRLGGLGEIGIVDLTMVTMVHTPGLKSAVLRFLRGAAAGASVAQRNSQMLEELSELSCTCHAVSQVARILRDGLRSEGMRSRQLRR